MEFYCCSCNNLRQARAKEKEDNSMHKLTGEMAELELSRMKTNFCWCWKWSHSNKLTSEQVNCLNSRWCFVVVITLSSSISSVVLRSTFFCLLLDLWRLIYRRSFNNKTLLVNITEKWIICQASARIQIPHVSPIYLAKKKSEKKKRGECRQT